ncbi:MAG: TIGR00300 family protein [Chloroflexi bacterium]|nr:TIGR00300 family protein [Chloroflexota bacterium]
MVEETVELRGHIIDSLLLPKVLDQVLARGAEFEIEQIDIGVRRSDPSHARIRLRADSKSDMDELLVALKVHGAEAIESEDAGLVAADIEGAFPEGFYSTTNLRTLVRFHGEWLEVENQEMDRGIVVNASAGRAFCTPMHRIRRGDMVVVGHRGVRVIPLERQARGQLFEFMGSDISPEKPKLAVVREVARELWKCRGEKKKTLFVGGPAVIHTGAGGSLAYLVREGFISVLLAGNGLAAHDIEYALYGTSLGVRLSDGSLVQGGHRNHLRAINAIRRAGSIKAAVESGLLTRGVMHACVTKGVPFVLAGSIRDDGPLPEVITDVVAAADAMRQHIRGAYLALVVASTLHAVAVGNILPAETRLVAVDINPASLTKLMDRGSFQTIGVVSDAGLFLRELVEFLQKGCSQ